MKVVISLIVGFFACLSLYLYLLHWDDTKLYLSAYSSYITLKNNPLIPSQDADIKAINTQSTRINMQELRAGGPPKDGIPAIDNPLFTSIKTTRFRDDELIIGVSYNGEAKAYPYAILNWHEIINDTIADLPISVTLCPLCDTTPVFIRKVNGKTTTFGVSGKLYQSCLVMYDRATDSLWVQPWGLAVAGGALNQSLQRIPAVKTTLGAWKKQYPNSKVLSIKTGYKRDYTRYPYGTYMTNETLVFPARNLSLLKGHPKAIISYIWLADEKTPQDHFSGQSFFITHETMQRVKKLEIKFDQQAVTVVWDDALNTVRFYAGEKEIPSSTAFNFVFPAFFYP